MTFHSFLAAGVGLALGTHALAQDCGGECGPRLGGRFVRPAKLCGHLGTPTYPLIETRYIKQFCGPHVSPESCFGYFKPKITPWGVACPNYQCDAPLPIVAAVPVNTTVPTPTVRITPAVKEAAPEPRPVPLVPVPEPTPDLDRIPPTGGLPESPKLQLHRVPELPPVRDPDYGPPPLPTIPTVPVSMPRH